MSACRSSVPQLWSCSCKTPVSIVAVGPSDNTRSWCGRTQLMNTSVGDQLTVGGQIGWSHAGQWQVDQGGDVELEASAAPVALAWCGHTIERLLPNVQLHSGQTAAGSWDVPWCRRTVSCSSPGDTKWTPGPASLRPQLTWIGRAVGAAVAGSSHCDTQPPPVQTATADCRWRLQGHAPSLRRWYVSTPLALLRRQLWPAAGENPTT